MSNILVGTIDKFAPDIQAMLLAKYSRSYEPIESRLPTDEQSEKVHRESLSKYYLSYGHRSIGQLGVTTVFLEGVSQLAAKAIENTPLYNGQESSTRYIDYSTQPMISSHPEIAEWQEKFRDFYIRAIPLTVEKLKAEFPFDANSGNYHHKESTEVQNARKLEVWNNTIKARAFDICRGFLPAGCVTNVGFQGTFDNINSHFGEMLHHPSDEMKELAKQVLTKLGEKYPYAAMSVEKLTKDFSYCDINADYFYYNTTDPNGLYDNSALYSRDVLALNINRDKFDKFSRHLSDRTRFSYTDVIDFGSYRDLHRHRNGRINMPVLDVSQGFNTYYSENIPKELQQELKLLLATFETWYKDNLLSNINLQYAVPMGYNVKFTYICDINQALYVLELRSGKTVHQTLRKVCHRWAQQLWKLYPQLNLHVDFDEDNFTLKRGSQTHLKT